MNPWNVEALAELENDYAGKIYNILQLRLHPSVIALKEKIENGPKNEVYDIDLQYYTSRGKWYHVSWKGDMSKSGGIATNIGCLLYTSPSPRDRQKSRMPSSA